MKKLQTFQSYVNEYIDDGKELQQNIIEYLDSSEENNENYFILIQTIEEKKILQNKNYLLEFFHLLVAISNNHHRNSLFFQKIEKIIIYFKDAIQNFLSEITIFNTFKSNKKILLFLIEKKILIPNQLISNQFTKEKYKKLNYLSYFGPEISKFLSDIPNNNDENFYRNRTIGENENIICNLIRNDMIIDFVIYVNRTNYRLNSKINKSIYETNPFLIDKTPTLIEYSAFFGSFQIFKYLQMNGVELTESIWIYAIHGNNPDIIHILEEFHINPKNNDYNECFLEAIKCHHNNIAEYLYINYVSINEIDQKEKINDIDNEDIDEDIELFDVNLYNQQQIIYNININKSLQVCLKHFNYTFFDEDEIDQSYKSIIYYLCKYDYPKLLETFVHMVKVNFNINTSFLVRKKQKYRDNRKFGFIYEYKKIYRTLLYTAIMKENLEIIKILLMFPEIDINKRSSIYYWEHIEIENNNIYENNIEWWKNKKYNIDKNDQRYEYIKINYPLNYSIKKQNLEIVQLLLSHSEVNLNQKSIIKKWNCILNEYITDCPEKTKEKENTAMITSIKKNNLKIINLLLLHPNLQINEKSILKLSDSNHRKYYNSETKITEIEYTPLSYSIENEKTEICQLLLTHPDIDVCCKIYEKYYKFEKAIKENYYFMHNWIINQILIKLYPNIFDNNYEIVKEAFHIAIHKRNNQIAQHLLLNYDIDVNANAIFKNNYTKKEESSLHIAAINDNLELFNHILSKSNIDINIKSINIFKNDCYNFYINKEESLLHIAVKNNNYEMVHLLLSRDDINVNELSENKETALNIAVNCHFYDIDQTKKSNKILKLLISHPSINVNYRNPLIRAVYHDNIKHVKILLSHPKIDVNSKNTIIENNLITHRETALHLAVEKRNIEIIKLLLSQPNIDVKTTYIRSIAGILEEKSILMTVLSETKQELPYGYYSFNRYFVKTIEYTKQKRESWTKDIQIFNLLLQHPDIDVNGKLISKRGNKVFKEVAPIHILVKNELADSLISLLAHPEIKINETMYKNGYKSEDIGVTALHIAIEKDNEDIIKLLLKNPKIDVNMKFNTTIKNRMFLYQIDAIYNMAAIHLAVKKNNENIIRLLLENPKINVNETMYEKTVNEEIDGMTALYLAIKRYHHKIFDILLRHPKIDINTKISRFLFHIIKNHGITEEIKPSERYEMTALHLAIEEYDFKTIQRILSNPNIDLNIPIIINYKNIRYSISTLHYACILSNKKIISEIFMKGANFLPS